MRRLDYSCLGLPKDSIIGNPLFIPFLDIQLKLDEFEKNPPPGKNYHLSFKTNGGCLWVAYTPHFHGLTGEIYLGNPETCIKSGTLVQVDIASQYSDFFGTSTRIEHEKIPLETLLDERILKQTNYQEAFDRLGILPAFEKKLAGISPYMNVVYIVTDNTNAAVDLVDFREGNKPKEKPISEQLKDWIGGLMPQPLPQLEIINK